MPTNNENQRLVLYDYAYKPFDSDPLRSFHNGHTGGSQEHLFFIRNHTPSKWYTNIQLTPVVVGGYDDRGEFGATGWSFQAMYGRRRPTLEEWDNSLPWATLEINDIGSCYAADTFTNHPVWVRITCPGGEVAQIRENVQLKITYSVKEVGACVSTDLDALMSEAFTGGYEGTYDGPYAVYGTSVSGYTAGTNGYFYPLYLSEEAANLADDISDGEQTSHSHTFSAYEGVTFYMPTSDMHHAMASSGGYPVYGTDLGDSGSGGQSSGSGSAAVGTITVLYTEGMENGDYVLLKSTDGTEIKYRFNFETDTDCVALNYCTGTRDDTTSPPTVHVNLGGVSGADVLATRLKTAIAGTTGHGGKIIVTGPVDSGSGEQVLTLAQAAAGAAGNTTIVYYQDETGGGLEITVNGFADGDDGSGSGGY